MCQGLLEESDGEGEPGEGQDGSPEAAGEDPDGDAQASAPPALLAAVEKKTEQQRRREKAARILVSTAGSGLRSPLPPEAWFLLPSARSLSCA